MATWTLSPWFVAVSGNAFSDEARILHEGLSSALSSGSSIALTERRMALDQVYWEASRTNWDGYGAKRLSIDVYVNALAFLLVLPLDIPDPDVTPEPDGEISFEWNRGSRKVFSVSIGRTPRLSFAGIFGSARLHGAEDFTGVLPETIVIGLHRVLSAERQASDWGNGAAQPVRLSPEPPQEGQGG